MQITQELRLPVVLTLLGLIVALAALSPRTGTGSGDFVSVTLQDGRTLHLGRTEVTQLEWQACHDAGACRVMPNPPVGAVAADYPVTGVNYFDVSDYLAWINSIGPATYRLPTADEWAEVSGGLSRRPREKLFDDPRLAWAADYGTEDIVSPKLRPSGAFGAFANGLADLRGNVWEWTATCVTETDTGHICPAAIAAGLHEAEVSVFIRDPATGGCSAGTPPAHLGFRLVRED